jgi:hypothetical protein
MELVVVIYNGGRRREEGYLYFRWLKFWALLGVFLVVVSRMERRISVRSLTLRLRQQLFRLPKLVNIALIFFLSLSRNSPASNRVWPSG